ncbi:MAG: ABC transporter permease [Bryobacteraceae bacterium]
MLLLQLGHAIRVLTRARGFTLAAILTLALGIGGNVAMFSLLNAVLLKPLPYSEAERLVFINTSMPKVKSPIPTLPVRAGYVLRWRTELKSFESIGAAIGTFTNLTDAEHAESLGTLRMTAELYDVLGVKPELGRWFRRAEEENGQPDVVVLSDALWRRRFSTDPQVLGRKILLDGKPHQVVGVAPAGMPFYRGQIEALLPDTPELFVPLRVPPAELDLTKTTSRYWCAVIGRLKRGVTLEQARAEIDLSMTAISRMTKDHLDIYAQMQPLQGALVGDTRKGLLALMGAVGFVLLIACVNIANLILVRATRNQHELAVRAALGASKGQLIGQSLAESLLIGVAGTVLGLLAASWTIDLVIAGAPTRLPRLEAVTLDQNVLTFSLALCVITTILFGLLPAWRISRVSLAGPLHSSGRSQTGGSHASRLRAVLIAAEAGLTTVLIIGAGLLLVSLQRVMNVPRGFETENIHAMLLALPQSKYQTLEQKASFFRRLDESLAAAPDVGRAGFANALPLAGAESAGSISPLIKEGSSEMSITELPIAFWQSVSPGYFNTLGIPLRSGRFFEEGEPQRVAMVTDAAARRIWPGENPIGKRIRHNTDRTGSHWFTVIGVVGDVHSTALDRPADSVVYYPYWQGYSPQSTGESILALYTRTPMPTEAVAASIRERVKNVDGEVALRDRGTLEGFVSNSVSPRRFQAFVVSGFGFIALLLASIGVYGVVSYSIAQRQKEFGIRMALGASQRDIASMMLRNGMRPVLAGMVLGLVAAAGTARSIESLLFEVRPLEPFVFAAAPLVLALLAALACYAPARRGSRTDPIVALRYD